MRTNSNKNSGLGIIFMVVLTLAAFVLAGVAINATIQDSPTVQTESAPAASNDSAPTLEADLPMSTLDGEWTAENNGSRFVALVSNDVITINLENADVSLIYWHGTFSSTNVNDVAIGSTAIEIDKMVMSRATSKTFELHGDTLSFEFTAMGVTKTVVLERA